jgi:hypothetical protein
VKETKQEKSETLSSILSSRKKLKGSEEAREEEKTNLIRF